MTNVMRTHYTSFYHHTLQQPPFPVCGQVHALKMTRLWREVDCANCKAWRERYLQGKGASRS